MSRLVALMLLATGACATTRPADSAASALYRDVQRVVTLSETTGWTFDRVELEKTLPDALQSVCRVEPAARAESLAWVGARIAAAGGDVQAAWRARRKDLDAVDDLLELTRIRMVLERAIAAAAADCPFWIEPEPGFRGRQIGDDRWLVSLGGGGTGILTHGDDQTDLQAGGGGRLLAGRQLGARVSLLGGLESGGSASFPKRDDGSRGSLVLNIDTTLLAVVRYHFVNTYVEGDLGYLARIAEGEGSSLRGGYQVGIAVGGRALRARWAVPGAAFGVSYKRVGGAGVDGGALHQFNMGFRVAVDIPFGR